MRRTRSPHFEFETLEPRLCLSAAPQAFTGTPISLPTTGAWTQTPFYGSPIFADLNGDGKQELIVEEAGGKLVAYGTNASGQLVTFQTYDTTPYDTSGIVANFKSTPVVVNMPGVGKVIVAALGRDESHQGTLEDGRVFAFNAVTGQVLPGWPQSTSLPPPDLVPDSGVTGALTIGYLEGNGMPDVVVDSFSTMVTAFRMNGTKLWQFENDETVEPGAVVADLFGDGKQEVILDSGIAGGGNDPFYQAGGFITILNGSDGSLVRRIHTGEVFFGAPVVADLFGDGRKEIIGATGPYFNTLASFTPAQQAAARAAGNRVYAFFADGTPVPGWPYHTTSNDNLNRQTWKEPIAADLYGNGQNEILEIDRSGVLHVILPSGQDAPGFVGGVQINSSSPFIDNTGGDSFSSPIVADVTGQGQQDIIVSRGYFLAAYDNAGNSLWSTFTTITPGTNIPNSLENAAAYGQFDPTGAPVLAFESAAATPPGPPQALQVFQLPATTAAPAWPLLRKDAQGQAIAFSTTAESAYVRQAYLSLFGRAANQAEVNYYVPLLTSKTITRFDLAASLAKASEGRGRFPGLLNVSDADTTRKVTSIYTAFGISAIPADSLAAIIYDAHRGRTYDDAAILIVGSGGNFAATNSVAPWAASLYRDIFQVQPTAAQIAGVVKAVDGGEAMGDVVKGLLTNSDARKGYIINQVRLLLGRAVTPTDLTLQNYVRREDVVIAIVSSPEFLRISGGTVAGFVNAAYLSLAGFSPSPTDSSSWVNAINNGSQSRASLAQALVTGSLYYNTFVVASLFQAIPDPSRGVLRVQLGSTGSATNPNPALVNIYTNLLVNRQATQEVVLASLMTSPRYLTGSTYFRGFYLNAGVRT